MALPNLAEYPDATPAPRARARVKRWLRAAALNGVMLGISVLLSLLLGELAIRIAAPQQLVVMRPDLWVARDSVGYWNAANVRTTVNTGERTATVISDAEGYRVGSAGRVEGDQTVLLLGDSFMKALQVDYEASLAGRLESGLTSALGRTVAVRAAGVDGWDPNQYLTFADRALPATRADAMVVALYVGNDIVAERNPVKPPLAPTTSTDFRLPRSAAPGELVNALVRPLNDRLERSSHLFVFLKNRGSALLMRAGLTGADFPWEIQKRIASSEAWDVTADLCREIAALGEQRGVPTVFVLVPSSYQVHREQFEVFVRGFGLDSTTVDLDQPNRLIGERLRARGLTVVDPLPELRAAAARGEKLFGSVDRHLSPDGHRVMNEAAQPVVAALLAARKGDARAGGTLSAR